MADHGNKQFRRAAVVSQAHRPPSVIPGLGVDVPELQQARRLWQLNRFDEALALFEKAVRQYPQNLVALVDASRALGARFEITRAEEMLDHLAKLSAHNPQVMHLAGQSYRMIFRPEKAIQCFEHLVAMTRKIPDAQLELAVLYERRHRVAEAYSLIEDCLRAEPDYLEALLFKARLLRRLKDAAGAEAIFRSLAANNEALPMVRAQAWTEIAQKLDREGDYDGAMAAMLQGKKLLMAEEGPFLKESEAVQRHLRLLAESLTPAHWQRWVEAGRAFPRHKMAVLASFPAPARPCWSRFSTVIPALSAPTNAKPLAATFSPPCGAPGQSLRRPPRLWTTCPLNDWQPNATAISPIWRRH